MLIFDCFLPKQELPVYKQYSFLKRRYDRGDTFIILNNTRVFEPFPEPEVSYDISELQKKVIYDKDLSALNRWIMTRIVINLGHLDYKTRGVLTRIATGMLNKIPVISKDEKNLLWTNMIHNIQKESDAVLYSQLPF